ncbi:MAG: class I SAM-dependent methyltransferase [Gammaproteobacteria bacterium]
MTANHWVKESAFGIWFLNTDTWLNRVLKKAIDDLETLLPDRDSSYPSILDVGCGRGKSFQLLEQHFKPENIFAIEIDKSLLSDAIKSSRQCHCKVNITSGNAELLPYLDQAFDMVFCHQSFHHIVRHEVAMREFYRVLKPGGVLLFAESCKRFIHSFLIRLLFRHPMAVQKSADEYLELIRKTGFQVASDSISKPYLWWSRPDLGAIEWLGFDTPDLREETLLNLVAIK